MGQNNSPLDYLAAFAIALIAGAISGISISKYIDRVRFEAIVFRRD